MKISTLIWRNLRFHARSHIGVVLGAAIGSAALTGALLVGDSVRESLRERALARLGWVQFAMASPERLFSERLGQSFPEFGQVAAVVQLAATLSAADGSARANNVNLFGVDNHFAPPASALRDIPSNAIVLNQGLARQIGARPGDEVVVRSVQPSALSQEMPVAPRNEGAVAMRLRVHAIVPPAALGDFALRAGQSEPFNAFMRRDELGQRAGLSGQANLLLVAGESKRGWNLEALQAGLEGVKSLSEWGLKLVELDQPAGLEVRSDRVFLEPEIARAANDAESTNHVPLITYLANLIKSGTNSTPYSMVTAAGPPYTPVDLKDDEILLTRWLADDLHTQPGQTVELSWFEPESGARLREGTNRFRVKGIVTPELPWWDRTLMPDFPGIQKAESTREWDAGFPLVYKIRPQDEAYWHQYRGTPKAFISLRAGERMWGNRFGNLTGIRFWLPAGMNREVFRQQVEQRLIKRIDPAAIGLSFEPVRAQALAGANQAQDFGQLFLGFSFFLVVAALLLMALLFQFGLEQRLSEVGTLLALGWRPKQVRWLLMGEGGALAVVGSVVGLGLGVGYARAMMWGLATIWRGAVGGSVLEFHATALSLAAGGAVGALVAFATLWLTLRKQGRQPARELLAGEMREARVRGGGKWFWVGGIAALMSALLAGWALARGERSDPGTFFGAGTLLLAGGLGLTAGWLGWLRGKRSDARLTAASLVARGCARRGKRSVATVALLACGAFVILAIGVFRLDANRDASKRSSGTGGFALIGQSTLPIVQDLNAPEGRDAFGLNAADLEGVSIVSLRVREGDDASCLNLTRAQRPRLLGARPQELADRHAFTFAKTLRNPGPQSPWLALDSSGGATDDAVPAIGDANSIQWALGKKVGDTLDYVDGRGRPFRVRLVGALANSVLQGNLLIDRGAFERLFPNESGYRMFLIDAPAGKAEEVQREISRALQDKGLEVIRAADKLNAFNAVQNTYLGTFQVLGGLGLLLGSAGLGVVVLRNVLERRGELALLTAVGFRRRRLHRLVLGEHGVLLGLGIGLGLLAALVAVMPALLTPGAQLPYLSLGLTLTAVLANGLVWAWLATRAALRGNLLEALRNE